MTDNSWNEPELVDYDSHRSEEGWRHMLDDDGHVWFYLRGRYYFVFPESKPYRFGMCYGEDEMTGNFPRWKFKDADELLSSPMFDGRSIKDFLPEVKGWEPGC